MPGRRRFYKRRSVQIGAAVVAIPIIALAWWLGSPLLIDEVVNEPFPRAAMAVVPDDMTAEEVEKKMVEAEAVDVSVEEDMPETEQAATTATAPTEETTEEQTATTTAAPTEETTEEQTATTATEETTEEQTATTATAPTEEEVAAPEPAGPVALATGPLMDGDSFHKGSGQVTLYRLEDGSQLLRLEDIEVTNGPQLHVILTPVHGVEGRGEVYAEGYLDLGPLKGNIGSQNYELPPGYQVPEEMTMVIYCVPFNVVFTTAELS